MRMRRRQQNSLRERCAREQLRSAGVRCALLWSALLLLSSCVPGRASGVATATPTATLTPTPVLGALPPTPTPEALPGPATTPLGPAPTNCPSSAPLQFGGFVGAVPRYGVAPVWMDFMPQTVIANGGPYDPWPGFKIIWEVGPHSASPAIIEATNLTTGKLAWWGLGGPIAQSYYGAAQALVLDPHTTGPAAYHGSPEPGWNEWGSNLYLLQAGCYALDAIWPGGHWRTIFAAGS